jgi:DNA primase catalytic subunit
MSFKLYFYEGDVSKEDEELAKNALAKLDAKDEEDIVKMKADEEELEELENLTEDLLEESVIKKPSLEILKDRYKQKGRLFLLKKLGGNDEISPKTIALFKLMFEFKPKMGRFGKWMIRGNKGEYIKNHPMVKEIKTIKKKRKKLKLMKRRGGVQTKIKRGKKVAKSKTSGKSVDEKGKIT